MPCSAVSVRTSRSAATSRCPSFNTCGLNRASVNRTTNSVALSVRKHRVRRLGPPTAFRKPAERLPGEIRESTFHRRVTRDNRLPRFAAQISDLGQPEFRCPRERFRSRRKGSAARNHHGRPCRASRRAAARGRRQPAPTATSKSKITVVAARYPNAKHLPARLRRRGPRWRCRAIAKRSAARSRSRPVLIDSLQHAQSCNRASSATISSQATTTPSPTSQKAPRRSPGIRPGECQAAPSTRTCAALAM